MREYVAYAVLWKCYGRMYWSGSTLNWILYNWVVLSEIMIQKIHDTSSRIHLCVIFPRTQQKFPEQIPCTYVHFLEVDPLPNCFGPNSYYCCDLSSEVMRYEVIPFESESPLYILVLNEERPQTTALRNTKLNVKEKRCPNQSTPSKEQFDRMHNQGASPASYDLAKKVNWGMVTAIRITINSKSIVCLWIWYLTLSCHHILYGLPTQATSVWEGS